VTSTRPHGPGNQGGHVGTCWARCVRARSGGARSPASSSPKTQTRSNVRARVETPSLAEPHHTQFGGEHASPLGNRRPRCYPHGPAWGTGFASCRPVGTGDDHAQVADCWVVPLKERPPLRMGLKPVPPLRTACMSSNGTRCPLDSRGLAAGARGGPFAVDFDLPRPRLSTSSWVFGADLRLITNEVAACRSQPPTSGDLAGYQPNPSAKG